LKKPAPPGKDNKPVPPVKAKAPVKAKKPVPAAKAKKSTAAKRKAAKRPHLGPAAQRAKDRSEAAKDMRDAAKARRGAARATAEARKAYLNVDAPAAKRDLALAARDRARSRKDQASAKHELAASHRKTGLLPRHVAAHRVEKARKKREKVKEHRAKHKEARPGLTGPAPGVSREPWVLGGNDWHSGCVSAAVANSLLLATGQRATDQEVLDLHLSVTGDAWATADIPAVLTELLRGGLAGTVPAAVSQAPSLDEAGIVVLELDDGVHAAALSEGVLITWGEAKPVSRTWLEEHALEAWQVWWG
jgi:hypothetical protein